jgi:hypothetical protein
MATRKEILKNEGQQGDNIRQDFFKKLKNLSSKGSLTGEVYSQAKEQLGKYGGVSSEAFESTMAKHSIKPSDPNAQESGGSTMKQDFFKKMKDLSKRGKLTPDMYSQAKEQLGKYEGVSGEAFESTMDKHLIKPSNFATAAPTSSPEEAAQNVMFQNEFGTGLGSLAAMQDDNYKLGSGSPLSQPARAIGPESGKYRRSARRLRRQGYGGAAQEMAMRGEDKRMNESAIDTPAARMQRMVGKIQVSREANKQDSIASSYTAGTPAAPKSYVGQRKEDGNSRAEQRNTDYNKRRRSGDKVSEDDLTSGNRERWGLPPKR